MIFDCFIKFMVRYRDIFIYVCNMQYDIIEGFLYKNLIYNNEKHFKINDFRVFFYCILTMFSYINLKIVSKL